MDKVIFVHIPKTAGTSLMTSLREDVGNTFFDYSTTKRWWSPLGKYRCILDSLTTTNISEPVIFGHFLAAKYADASLLGFKKRKGHLYVTFAREPLQRAISHYHYWDRVELPGHRLWRQFRKERWPLDRFLLSCKMANIYSKYLWGFPIENFDFIGLSERYEESIRLLIEAVPALRNLKSRNENVNPNSAGQGYAVDASLADAFKKLNVADYEIYENICASFGRKRQFHATAGRHENGTENSARIEAS